MCLVALNDVYLIMFHQMIPISDGLCKLGYIKCQPKLIKVILVILTNFACIILGLACKIFNFIVIFRAKCSIFWPFTKNLGNNRRITEKY